MNETILNELEYIQDLLIMILVVLVIFFVSWASILIINLRSNKEPDEKRAFVDKAQNLYDGGNFKSLLSFSLNRSNELPHDAHALWYSGLALYKMGQFGKALALFTDLKRLDPLWNKQVVDDYICDIKKEMNGPKNI